MCLIRLFLLIFLLKVVQSRNTYEQSQSDSGDVADMNGDSKKSLKDTVISVPEKHSIITDQTLEPFLIYSLQEKLLRIPNTFVRQKRQTETKSEKLKQLLSTKKGRKLAAKLSRRKALLKLLKRRRKLRKQRKLRKDEPKEINNSTPPTVSTDESKASGRQNNPSSTNEINLTVQVDMNNPFEPKDDKNIKESSLPQENINQHSSPPLGGLHRDYPIASQKNQVPRILDTDVFGVNPSINNPLLARTVPDIYRDQSFESRQMYPSVPGLISGQNVIKNKAFVKPAYPKPILEAVPHGNFPNRISPLWNNEQQTLLQVETKQDTFPGIQKDKKEVNKNDQRKLDIFQTNSNHPDSQHETNLDLEQTLKTKEVVDDSGESNAANQKVQINGEIKNLLQDIKTILNTRQIVAIKDDESMASHESEKKLETNSELKESFEEQPDSKPSSLTSSESDQEEFDSVSESREVTENKHRQTVVPEIEMQQYEQTALQKAATDDNIESFDKNTSETLDKDEVFLETSDAVQNSNVSNEIFRDPNAVYEEKLSSLSKDDIIKTLQHLNLISKRENKVIQRVSKKWKDDDYLQNTLDELMRRRYFRKSLERVLENAGVSRDKLSAHNLMIHLLRLEDIMFPVEKEKRQKLIKSGE